MVLTEKDRQELHDAIVEYLRAQHCGQIADQLQNVFVSPSTPFVSTDAVLERRWRTLRRLGILNIELEAQNKKLREELQQLKDPKTIVHGNWLPVEGQCVATLRGHRGPVTAVCAHPTESLCLSSSEDGTLRVWDLTSRRVVKVIREHRTTSSVTCVAVDPTSGSSFASGATDNLVKIFDGFSQECTQTLRGHEDALTAVAYVPGEVGVLVSASKDGDLRVWDTHRGVLKAQKRHDRPWIRAIAVSGPLIAFAASDNAVVVWNWVLQTTVAALEGIHSNTIEALCFSNELVDAVIDPRTAKAAPASVSPSSSANGPAQYTPKYVATGGRDKLLFVTDVQGSLPVMSFVDHNNWIRQVAFSSNGTHLVSCCDDGALHVYDLRSKQLFRRLVAHDTSVTGFAQQVCGRFPLLVTGSADHCLKLWACEASDQ